MKRILLLILTISLLAACGGNDLQQENSEQELSDEDFEAESITDIEVEEETFDKFVDPSIGMEVIGMYYKLKNDSDVPVSIQNVSITLFDSNDNILSVEDDILPAPYLLDTGDSGYVSSEIDYEDNYEDLDYLELDYYAEQIDVSEINKLEVSKENIMKDDGFFVDDDEKEMFDSIISDAVKVTFNISNDNVEELDNIYGVGYYGEDGEFLGSHSSTNYFDDNDVIKPNGDKNEETLAFLPAKFEEVKEVDIKAIGIPLFDE